MIRSEKDIKDINVQLDKLSKEIKFMMPWFQGKSTHETSENISDSKCKSIYNKEPFKQFIESSNKIRLEK
jgi:hypothetical protein